MKQIDKNYYQVMWVRGYRYPSEDSETVLKAFFRSRAVAKRFYDSLKHRGSTITYFGYACDKPVGFEKHEIIG